MTCGLWVSGESAAEPNAAMTPISDSYAHMAGGLYRLMTLGKRYYRRIGLPPASEGPGVSNINETIDSSVFDRWRADKTYRPPGLGAWAKRNKVDPERIKGSVRADNPAITVAN